MYVHTSNMYKSSLAEIISFNGDMAIIISFGSLRGNCNLTCKSVDLQRCSVMT